MKLLEAISILRSVIKIPGDYSSSNDTITIKTKNKFLTEKTIKILKENEDDVKVITFEDTPYVNSGAHSGSIVLVNGSDLNSETLKEAAMILYDSSKLELTLLQRKYDLLEFLEDEIEPELISHGYNKSSFLDSSFTNTSNKKIIPGSLIYNRVYNKRGKGQVFVQVDVLSEHFIIYLDDKTIRYAYGDSIKDLKESLKSLLM